MWLSVLLEFAASTESKRSVRKAVCINLVLSIVKCVWDYKMPDKCSNKPFSLTEHDTINLISLRNYTSIHTI